MAYIGRLYTARLAETVDGEFCCKFCGHRAWARVTAAGVGTASSPYFLNNKGAEIRAVDDAARDALDVAHQAFDGVACPRCGKRKEASFDGFAILLMIPPILLGGVIGFLGGKLEVAAVGALVGGAIGLIQRLRRRSRVRRAAKEVEFFAGEPPDLPYVGKRCITCARSIVTKDNGTRCQTCGAPIHHEECAQKHWSTHPRPGKATSPGESR